MNFVFILRPKVSFSNLLLVTLFSQTIFSSSSIVFAALLIKDFQFIFVVMILFYLSLDWMWTAQY